MSDHTLSMREYCSPLKGRRLFNHLDSFELSCWILYFCLKYAILFPKIEFALLDTYSKHELTKALSLVFHTV